MKTLIVGHRGAGKTTFAGRLFGRGFVDLDEHLRGRGFDPELLLPEREDVFRRQESETLVRLLEGKEDPDTQVVVAGAGAVVDDRPQHGPEAAAAALRAKARFCGWQVVWIRRDSDDRPRLHLDRPESSGSGAGGLRRRERFYRLAADRVLTLPEGLEHRGSLWHQASRIAMLGRLNLPDLVFPIAEGEGDAEEVFSWGSRAELRDDRLSPKDLKTLAALFRGRSVISLRDPERVHATVDAWTSSGGILDVPDDRDGPVGAATMTSFHERSEPLETLLGRAAASLEKRGVVKVAVEIMDERELATGDAWASEDPLRRAFVPRSEDGRWGWYRLVRPGLLPFTRRGRGTSPDQPTLVERVAFSASSGGNVS